MKESNKVKVKVFKDRVIITFHPYIPNKDNDDIKLPVVRKLSPLKPEFMP